MFTNLDIERGPHIVVIVIIHYIASNEMLIIHFINCNIISNIKLE